MIPATGELSLHARNTHYGLRCAVFVVGRRNLQLRSKLFSTQRFYFQAARRRDRLLRHTRSPIFTDCAFAFLYPARRRSRFDQVMRWAFNRDWTNATKHPTHAKRQAAVTAPVCSGTTAQAELEQGTPHAPRDVKLATHLIRLRVLTCDSTIRHNNQQPPVQ